MISRRFRICSFSVNLSVIYLIFNNINNILMKCINYHTKDEIQSNNNDDKEKKQVIDNSKHVKWFLE